MAHNSEGDLALSLVLPEERKRSHSHSSSARDAEFDSDTENEKRPAAKYNSIQRGRTKTRGTGLARARAELKEKKAEAMEEAFERQLQKRAFRKEAPVPILDIEEDDSCSEMHNREDSARRGTEELRADAGRNAAIILEVARKSGNLKGPFIKKLKDSASALIEIVEALVTRTEADETRHLKAENSRLHREIEGLKAELKAHRREFTEMRTSMAAARQSASGSCIEPDFVETLKASIVSSVGLLIDARFAGIEERLLPATIHRPPLASDGKRASTTESSQRTPDVASRITRKAGRKIAVTNPAVQPAETDQSAPTFTAEGPSVSTPVVEMSHTETANTWSTVVKKGGKGKKSAPTASSAAPTSSPVTENARPSQPAKPKLAVPRTAAVMITLQPEAVERGITYAQVMERAEQAIKLDEIGISSGIKIHRSVTGARLLELPKTQSPEQADQLAEQLRTVLDGIANVVRPIKCADIRITGLGDTVTKAKLAAAVAHAGNCAIELVKASEIQIGPGGMGMSNVKCPVMVAQTLSDVGRVLVGWSSARVSLLEQRPLRCFKCLGVGHTRPLCTSAKDRSELCFRCGCSGHKLADCTGALHCAVCAEAGKPSGHVMGGRRCNPPSTSGKSFQKTVPNKDHNREQGSSDMSLSP